MSSVFSKIISGQFPCYKIFEDEKTFSFLSIDPIQLGHTLVVPKIEVDHFIDVPEEYYLQVMKNAQFIAKAIQQATGCVRVGTMIQGWEVPHFHYHLVPMYDPSDLSFLKAKKRNKEEMESVCLKINKQIQEILSRV